MELQKNNNTTFLRAPRRRKMVKISHNTQSISSWSKKVKHTDGSLTLIYRDACQDYQKENEINTRRRYTRTRYAIISRKETFFLLLVCSAKINDQHLEKLTYPKFRLKTKRVFHHWTYKYKFLNHFHWRRSISNPNDSLRCVLVPYEIDERIIPNQAKEYRPSFDA